MVFGMTCATVIGIFLVPVCYVFIEQITQRKGSRAKKVSSEATKTREGDIAKSEA